jgi:hypothetical protein
LLARGSFGAGRFLLGIGGGALRPLQLLLGLWGLLPRPVAGMYRGSALLPQLLNLAPGGKRFAQLLNVVRRYRTVNF